MLRCIEVHGNGQKKPKETGYVFSWGKYHVRLDWWSGCSCNQLPPLLLKFVEWFHLDTLDTHKFFGTIVCAVLAWQLQLIATQYLDISCPLRLTHTRQGSHSRYTHAWIRCHLKLGSRQHTNGFEHVPTVFQRCSNGSTYSCDNTPDAKPEIVQIMFLSFVSNRHQR